MSKIGITLQRTSQAIQITRESYKTNNQKLSQLPVSGC